MVDASGNLKEKILQQILSNKFQSILKTRIEVIK